MCEHIMSPNYSVDHHKSRYVPAILQSRYLQSARRENLVTSDLSMAGAIKNKRNDEEDHENNIDENTDVKELVQKLYEMIYMKMSDAFRAKQFYNMSMFVSSTIYINI